MVIPVDDMSLKLSLGRFSQCLNVCFRGIVSAPWQIGALALFLLAMGNYCVLRLFGRKSLPNMVLFCGLVVTSITVTSCCVCYIHELDNYALAYFLAALAAYHAVHHRYGYLIAPCLVALAVGLYQAYFSVTCSLLVIYLMCQILRARAFKENLRLALKLLGILILGILLYASIHQTIMALGGLEEREAYNGISNATSFSHYAPIMIPLLKGTYKSVAMYFAAPITAYSQVLLVLNGLLFVIGALLAIRLCLVKRIHWLNILLLGGLALSLPFAMNLSFFLAKGMIHQLMLFSFTFVYLCILLIVQIYREELADSASIWSKPVQYLTWGAMALLVFYHSNNANQIYLQAHLIYQNTLSTVTRMLYQIENTEGYELGLTPVALIGSMSQSELELRRRGFEHTEGLYGIAKNTNLTYSFVYRAFFAHVLSYPIRFCDEEQVREWGLREDVLAMPQFPHRGWCQMIDGKMVIKLSDPISPPN